MQKKKETKIKVQNKIIRDLAGPPGHTPKVESNKEKKIRAQRNQIIRDIARIRSYQGKTPCADSTCADCPGFLVLGAADARAPSFVQEPQAVSLD